uniref:Splicing factor YJU2 n=1 Tax=Leptobrachium leishanense TaxID=445787 RepID=A0A8C5M7N3_9ANUR
MSERKVLNKYYPPDFDPSKIPKLKLPKDRQYVVRLMAPFNMRCKTCGEYIYKGKKFNARKETVQNELYLGLPIFRFYIKCTRCLAEITFKTDPENTDYAIELGATRNFQAEKLIEQEEIRFQKEREEEELNNPMKVLENRTKDSKLEMEVLENLQELKELNQRQANVDFESMLDRYRETEEEIKKRQEDEDEMEMSVMLAEAQKTKQLNDSDSDEDSHQAKQNPTCKINQTDILVEHLNTQNIKTSSDTRESSKTILNSRQRMSQLVRKRECSQNREDAKNNTEESQSKRAHYNKAANCGTASTHSPHGGSGRGSESNQTVPSKSGTSSLALLSTYSDSEESE